MASVKQTRTHDMLQLRLTYAKGSSLLLTCSRNGESIKLVPEDLDLAIGLGSLVAHVKRGLTDPASPVPNFGVMFDILEEVAKTTGDYPAFLAAARARLAIPVGLPAPAGRGTPPAQTRAVHKPGRSQSVEIAFASGETVLLTIAGSSVGIQSNPSVRTINDRITRFAFSARAMGFEPEASARAIASYAQRCPDLVSFTKGLGLPVLQGVSP